MVERSPRGAEDRGVSEVVGVVLLLGLVVAGTAIVIMAGSAAKDGLKDQSDARAAELSMQELDSDLGSLAAGDGEGTVSFSVTSRDSESVRVETGDRLHLQADGDPACSTTLPLDALVYDLGDGRQVVYQGGGVFRTGEGDPTMVAPPDLAHRNDTVHLSLVDVEDAPEGSTTAFTARERPALAERRLTERRAELFSRQACTRPETFTLTVESDRFAGVWADYLREAFPGAVVETGEETAAAELDWELLPERADDDRNQVVDFASDAAPGRVEGDRLVVDKGDGNEYDASLSILGSHVGHADSYETERQRHDTVRVPVNRTVAVPANASDREPITETVREPVNETRMVPVNRSTPMDVVFVIDESGSMRGGKLADARRAARGFLEVLPDGRSHRVGVVGYSWAGFDEKRCGEAVPDSYDDRYLLDSGCAPSYNETTLYQGLTANFDDAENGVDSLETKNHTPIGEGLHYGVEELVENGDTDRERTVVLLTDGKHNRGRSVDGPVDRARAENVSIHTVGVGRDANATLLGRIADRTGGEYTHVDDSNELVDVFEGFAQEETYVRREVVDHYEERTVVTGYRTTESESTTTREVVDHFEERRVLVGTERVDRDRIVDRPATVSLSAGDREWSMRPGETPEDRAVNYVEDPASDAFAVADGEPLAVDGRFWHCDSVVTTGETTSHAGTTYRHARCSGVTDAPDRPREVALYVDGDPLPAGDDPWFQPGVESVVPERLREDGSFDLASNQVVVVFEYGDAGGVDHNNVVALAEVGQSRSAVSADWLLGLDYNVVDLSG